jgi:predicted helicase
VIKKKGWNIYKGWENLQNSSDISEYIKPISYRPFDKRFIIYEDKLVWRVVKNIMQHFLNIENVGLITIRRSRKNQLWNFVGVTDCVVSGSTAISSLDINYVFPLYLKPEKNNGFTQPNLNMSIVKQIAKRIGIAKLDEKQFSAYSIKDEFNQLTPLNIFDYVYGVLHSPRYREKYKEFLKIDFPKIPYPANVDEFWHYSKAGSKLRKLHLMEGIFPDNSLANYTVEGNNVVDKVRFEPRGDYQSLGKVFINDTQYFDNVPQNAWDFYIGGYQPAQKWLKDKKGKALSFDDVIHYQKIINILVNTMEEMGKIDSYNDI